MCLRLRRLFFSLWLLSCSAFLAFASEGTLPDPRDMTDIQILQELSQTFRMQQESSARRLEKLEAAQTQLQSSMEGLQSLQARLTALEDMSKGLRSSLETSSQTLQETKLSLEGSMRSLQSLQTEWEAQAKAMRTRTYLALGLGALGMLAATLALTVR